MAVAFQSITFAHSNNTSTATVVTAAFTTTGTNRALGVMVGITNSTGRSISSIARGSDTFSSVGVENTIIQAHAQKTTNEPQTGSAALTVTMTSAFLNWCVAVVAADGVDQTNRINGWVVNADTSGSTLDPLAVATTTGDLVVDFFCGRNDWSGLTPSGSQTNRGGVNSGGTDGGSLSTMRVSTLPGSGTSVNMDWSDTGGNPLWRHVAFNFIQAAGNAAPVVINPGAIDAVKGVAKSIPITISDADSNIATFRLQCTEAKGDWSVSLAGGGSISAGSNNSHDLTVSGTHAQCVAAALTAEYTPTAVGSDTACIATADDGTDDDAETFTVNAYSMIIAGNQSQINAALATLEYESVAAYSGADTLTIVGVDATDRTDSEDIGITVSGNTAPVVTVPGAQEIIAGVSTAIQGVSVADAEGNLATIRAQSTTINLTVALSGTVEISAGANGSTDLTISGMQAELNTVINTLLGTGTEEVTENITITATDSEAENDVETIAVTVTAQVGGVTNSSIAATQQRKRIIRERRNPNRRFP